MIPSKHVTMTTSIAMFGITYFLLQCSPSKALSFKISKLIQKEFFFTQNFGFRDRSNSLVYTKLALLKNSVTFVAGFK